MTLAGRSLRAAALILVLLTVACSDDEPAPAVPDTAATAGMGEGHENSGHHGHGTPLELAEGVPVPSIAIEVTEDPVEGWNLRVRTTDFNIVPENASTTHIDGQGHMHLYIDGEKVSRIYGEWHHIGPLEPGEHEVRVELSSNNHSALAVGGEIIDATAHIVAGSIDGHADEGGSNSGHDHEAEDGSDSSHDHDHQDEDGHRVAGETTRYDADVADAIETITLEVVGGAPVGGHQRVEVDLGSVVAVMVTSDIAEEVHVHGYDILRAVSAGHPAHFAFNAEIPGVFEVELEGSGRLLLLLEIS